MKRVSQLPSTSVNIAEACVSPLDKGPSREAQVQRLILFRSERDLRRVRPHKATKNFPTALRVRCRRPIQDAVHIMDGKSPPRPNLFSSLPQSLAPVLDLLVDPAVQRREPRHKSYVVVRSRRSTAEASGGFTIAFATS